MALSIEYLRGLAEGRRQQQRDLQPKLTPEAELYGERLVRLYEQVARKHAGRTRNA